MVKITQQLRKWQSCEEITLNVPFLFLRCFPKREERTYTNTDFNLHKVVYTQIYVWTHTLIHVLVDTHVRTYVSHRYSPVLTKTESALHTCTVTLTHQTYTNIQILTPSHADAHTHISHTQQHILQSQNRLKGPKA